MQFCMEVFFAASLIGLPMNRGGVHGGYAVRMTHVYSPESSHAVWKVV